MEKTLQNSDKFGYSFIKMTYLCIYFVFTSEPLF